MDINNNPETLAFLRALGKLEKEDFNPGLLTEADIRIPDHVNLSNMVAVVKDGVSGVGLLAARALKAAGARVYLVGPQGSALDEVRNLYGTGGQGSMHVVHGSLLDNEAVTRVVAEVQAREPNGIHLLVNYFGVPTSPFSHPEPSADQAIATVENQVMQARALNFHDFLDHKEKEAIRVSFAFLPLLDLGSNGGQVSHVLNVLQLPSCINDEKARDVMYEASFSAMHELKDTLHDPICDCGGEQVVGNSIMVRVEKRQEYMVDLAVALIGIAAAPDNDLLSDGEMDVPIGEEEFITSVPICRTLATDSE